MIKIIKETGISHIKTMMTILDMIMTRTDMIKAWIIKTLHMDQESNKIQDTTMDKVQIIIQVLMISMAIPDNMNIINKITLPGQVKIFNLDPARVIRHISRHRVMPTMQILDLHNQPVVHLDSTTRTRDAVKHNQGQTIYHKDNKTMVAKDQTLPRLIVGTNNMIMILVNNLKAVAGEILKDQNSTQV